MLISSRSFMSLFLTQFLGAFNDNLLKNALVILITFRIAAETGDNAQILVTLAAGIFILPFFLFSASAGQLADKYERTFIIKLVKISEVLIMILASFGFIYHKSWFLIFVLFAAGVHSTFFGPIKYAILPQIVTKTKLISANAYISAATFIAILMGTICGGLLILHDFGTYYVSAILCTIALLGLITCFFIPRAPAPVPSLTISHNFIRETWRIIEFSKANSRVFIAVLGISWFWFVGATFLSQFPNFVKDFLHAEPRVVTIFLTLFTVGIAIGSFICNKLLKGAIKTTYAFIAAVGLSLFTIDLYFASQNIIYDNHSGLFSWQVFIHMDTSFRIMLDLLCTAIFAGIFIVPLYAIVQHESDNKYRARIIAANNVLNSLFMVIAAIFTLSMLVPQRTIPEVFLVTALLNLPVGYLVHKYLSNKK